MGGAIAGGFVGTVVLTTTLSGASYLGFTRMDIPFLLGTAFSPHRARAKVIGYTLHFAAGLVFALGYYGLFLTLGPRPWWLGTVFGVVHALFAGTVLVNVALPSIHPRMGTPLTAADTATLLEPPGFMLLNYGRSTPLVTLLAHMAYGAIVAAFITHGAP